jgi:hypothetical protein
VFIGLREENLLVLGLDEGTSDANRIELLRAVICAID